jgi:hypothetical protein
MKRALAILILAGCGHGAAGPSANAPGDDHAAPPTCDAIIAHLAIVFEQHYLAPDDRKQLVASCETSNPPPAERACVMRAEAPADIDACGRDLARKPGAAAPADPREDLLALGVQVAKYRVELGEPPPSAGPTPPAGTCCAAACALDASQWTGPWQLVRFGLDHPTRWSFEIVRPDDGMGPTVVHARGCPGEKSYALSVAPGATPTAADVTVEAASP